MVLLVSILVPLIFDPLTTLIDVQVLNFALTLEHLENAFYTGALQKFSDADFAIAGFESFTRGRFTQIAAHEASHVQFLSSALGDAATKLCTYNLLVAHVCIACRRTLMSESNTARTRMSRALLT